MINRKYIHRLEQKEPHILILIIMSSFASMGAIIFTPALLPEIGEYFNISQGHSQLTKQFPPDNLTLYLHYLQRM
jgi:hypothetical protein